jgi:hypothetical protein
MSLVSFEALEADLGENGTSAFGALRPCDAHYFQWQTIRSK